ncbi:DnaJ domain-containing protein [Uliginosibacterium sediminicola]|uniref:DnaJ domain-containing protein n=1 Tax=Uliginosibacterium sediminicola TaxID=2024550 RepID=A0ABU9YWN1_9RHOO
MSDKKSLYDMLEVSRTASAEAIEAAFARLSAQHTQGRLKAPESLSAEAFFSLIKDAYFVLGNPLRRAEYDRKFQSSVSLGIDPAFEEMGLSLRSKLLIGLVVAAVGAYGYQSHQDSLAKQARIQAEQAAALKLEAQRAALLAEEEARRAQAQARAMEDSRQYQARIERERAIAEADRVSYKLRSAEETQRREAERKSREDEYRKQEELRRAQAERQRVVNEARRLDYENSRAVRGGVVASPTPAPAQATALQRR